MNVRHLVDAIALHVAPANPSPFASGFVAFFFGLHLGRPICSIYPCSTSPQSLGQAVAGSMATEEPPTSDRCMTPARFPRRARSAPFKGSDSSDPLSHSAHACLRERHAPSSLSEVCVCWQSKSKIGQICTPTQLERNRPAGKMSASAGRLVKRWNG